jgi:hypothetical protein
VLNERLGWLLVAPETLVRPTWSFYMHPTLRAQAFFYPPGWTPTPAGNGITWNATRLVSPNRRHVLDFLFGNNVWGSPPQVAGMGLKNILELNVSAQTVCTDNWRNVIPFAFVGVSSGETTAYSVGTVTGNFAGYYAARALAQEFSAFVRDVVMPVLASFPKTARPKTGDSDGDEIPDNQDRFREIQLDTKLERPTVGYALPSLAQDRNFDSRRTKRL